MNEIGRDCEIHVGYFGATAFQNGDFYETVGGGGAEWAMELLYHRYERYTFALAHRILRDVSTAEDIVQEPQLRQISGIENH